MKKTVRYSDLGFVRRGANAWVTPVDHPNAALNGRPVQTSLVLKVEPHINGPKFETLNTIYSPADQEPMPSAYNGTALHV